MSRKERDRSWPPDPEPLPVPVYDNHCHLDSDHGNPHWTLAENLDHAEASGIRGALTVGCDLPTARWTAQAVTDDPRLLGAVAIHPNDAPQLMAEGTWDEAIAEIGELARGERIRAIGETGLDHFRTGPDGHAQQVEAFRAHIALAKELGKPMQIHDRDSHADVMATLLADGAPERTVFHCFSGDREMAEVCAEHGWYLSFAGTLTFSPNEYLREALRAVPIELVMVETDAPYLAPMPYRGRPNGPYLATLTMRCIAEVKGLELADACSRVAATSEAVYGPW